MVAELFTTLWIFAKQNLHNIFRTHAATWRQKLVAYIRLVSRATYVMLKISYLRLGPGYWLFVYDVIMLDIYSFGNLAIGNEHLFQIPSPSPLLWPSGLTSQDSSLGSLPHTNSETAWSLHQSISLAPFYITPLLYHRYPESGKTKLSAWHLLALNANCLHPLILDSCNV